MNSKKKLLISVCSLCLVVVAAVVGVVAVWAFAQQTVTSNISVKYTAVQVAGSVSANYTVGSTTEKMYVGGENKPENESITYLGNEPANNQATLAPEGNKDITLTGTNTFVVFEYKFTNSALQRDYSIELKYTDDTPADVNVNVFVVSTGNKLDLSDYESDATWGNAVTMSATETVLVDKNSTVVEHQSAGFYVYVKVAIENLANDASFNGAFAWNLAALQPAA